MPESNHAALGEGLRLYTDAMRAFVKERLTKHYPNSWWQSGVMQQLTEAQQRGMAASMRQAPSKDRLEHVDANHLPRIISRNFNGAFAGCFDDFQKTQSLLDTVAAARNEWAHPRSGDIPEDDVAHALYAVAQLLKAADPAEAEQVEAIRRHVLGLGPEAVVPVVAKEPVVTAPGELPYWWQVCEPHDGFKNPASIDVSLFAATLGGVDAGSARDEFKDPAIFFSHTHFTENLKQTVRDVARRLSGGDGPSVLEMQTPFGGGKTHALLTLYHLIKHPKASLAVPGVREALGDVAIPAGARVLAFDGQDWGTAPKEKENGASVWSLWGELAFQVSPTLFNRLVVDCDSRGEAPGNDVFRQVLQAASPCLLLLDELVSYLVKLKFANTQRTRNQYRQTVQFLQEMLQEAGNVPGVCVLISLPKSRVEFGGLDPEQLQRELGIVDELQARSDRVVAKRTPVNDDEIYTLMSKRLFKRADPGAAARVARMYREVYERTRAVYDQTIFSDEYRRQFESAYPLHPALIDVLYKKWSTATDFPRTRTVLQLLAGVVADQWVNHREAYTIQPAHVNLEREGIRSKVVSAAGSGGGYDAVVAADIIGGDAHADEQDRRRGAEYERYQVCRGVATTLLMHSFGGQTRAGAAPSELCLGTVAPNVGPEYVTEVLRSLEQSLWYVHREGELLRFETKANIYRVIAQRAENQPPAAVAERLRSSLSEAVGSAPGFRVLDWAGTEGAIADRPEISLAVLAPSFAVEQEEGGALWGRERIDQLWEKAGGGLRQWRNALILVAPDRELWAKAEEAMREVMAYESVAGGGKKAGVDLGELELKELRSRAKEKGESLRTSIVTAYRWVFHPDAEGLTVVGLPVPATAKERIVERVVERLSDQNYGTPKILRKMGAVYFDSKVAPHLWKDEGDALELGELARRFQQWTYLPILPERDATLRACVREGLGLKLWAVVIGDHGAGTYRQVIERPEELDTLTSLFDGSAALAKGTFVQLVKEQLGVVPPTTEPEPQPEAASAAPRRVAEARGDEGTTTTIPRPARYTRVRLRVSKLSVAKTSNLQPYLFKVLQEQDPGAELSITIDAASSSGISEEALEKRIVEGFDQLGIGVTWEPG